MRFAHGFLRTAKEPTQGGGKGGDMRKRRKTSGASRVKREFGVGQRGGQLGKRVRGGGEPGG